MYKILLIIFLTFTLSGCASVGRVQEHNIGVELEKEKPTVIEKPIVYTLNNFDAQEVQDMIAILNGQISKGSISTDNLKGSKNEIIFKLMVEAEKKMTTKEKTVVRSSGKTYSQLLTKIKK